MPHVETGPDVFAEEDARSSGSRSRGHECAVSDIGIIDIEAKVIPMETPDCPERDTAQRLLAELEERQRDWSERWEAVLVDASTANYHQATNEDRRVVMLSVGERRIATFAAWFEEETCGLRVEADYPKQ